MLLHRRISRLTPAGSHSSRSIAILLLTSAACGVPPPPDTQAGPPRTSVAIPPSMPEPPPPGVASDDNLRERAETAWQQRADKLQLWLAIVLLERAAELQPGDAVLLAKPMSTTFATPAGVMSILDGLISR